MLAYKVVRYDRLVDRRTSKIQSGDKCVYYAEGVKTVPNPSGGPLCAFSTLKAAVMFDEFIGRPDSEIWECEVVLSPDKYPYMPPWMGSIACTEITLTRRVRAW